MIGQKGVCRKTLLVLICLLLAVALLVTQQSRLNDVISLGSTKGSLGEKASSSSSQLNESKVPTNEQNNSTNAPAIYANQTDNQTTSPQVQGVNTSNAIEASMDSVTDKENLVQNGDFEKGTGNIAFSWTYRNDVSSRNYRDPSNPAEGNYSYYIWTNDSNINSYSEYFDVVQGGQYCVSFYAKTLFHQPETAAGLYLSLRARNATSEETVQYSIFLKTTTNWNRYEYIWQVPLGQNYTQARLRITSILNDNTGGDGAAAWIDNLVVMPQIRSVICSQPFLINYDSLPSTLSFSAQFMNATTNPTLNANNFRVRLGNRTLKVNSVAYNKSSRLYDIWISLPLLEQGKYILKLQYGSHESLNFKGVNIYRYSGDFRFIHWTDVHYNPPIIGFESQLNVTLQMLKNANPDFIIMTGDMGSTEANYQRFYAILSEMNFDIPIFFCMGNHEKESATSLNSAVLYMGENRTSFGNEFVFTFNYGKYQFIGLDTGVFPYASAGNISAVQYDWLKSELLADEGSHLIVFCHHPLYFRDTNDFWLNSSVARSVMSLMSSKGVETVLAGHAHRSDVSMLDGVSYYATVSGHNDTHWLGPEPYPSAGFRLFEVVNNSIVSATVRDTFSYYTGELVADSSLNTSVAGALQANDEILSWVSYRKMSLF